MKRFILVLAVSFGWPLAAHAQGWQRIQAGVEYRSFEIEGAHCGTGLVHLVRIDPTIAELTIGQGSAEDDTLRSAAQWCQKDELSVAINAGMYQTDFETHVGYLRHAGVLNNGTWHPQYESVLLLHPEDPDDPRALLRDRSELAPAVLDSYGTVVQNLRLIKAPSVNVWSKQPRQWTEAAIAVDSSQRLLFIFVDVPLAMAALNEKLLELPIHIVRAMHVEGGPEASLSIHGSGIDLDLSGQFETGFWETCETSGQWEIPLIIGVKKAPEVP